MLNTSTPSPKSDWFLRVSFVSRQIHFRTSPGRQPSSRRPPQSVSTTLLPIKTSLRTPITSPRPSRLYHTTYRNIRGGWRRCSSTAISAVGHVRGLLNPRQEKNCKIGATDTVAAGHCLFLGPTGPLSGQRGARRAERGGFMGRHGGCRSTPAPRKKPGPSAASVVCSR